MYAPQEIGSSKKSFQKPNILRRRPKIWPKPNQVIINEHKKAPVAASIFEPVLLEPESEEVYKDKSSKLARSCVGDLPVENNNCEHNENTIEHASQENQVVDNTHIELQITDCDNVAQSIDIDQNTLNIELFINDATSNKIMSQKDADEPYTNKLQQVTTKWCLDLSSSNMDSVVNEYNAEQTSEKEQNEIDMVPTIIPLNIQNVTLSQQASVTTTQTISVDCFTNRAIKFKCDEPDCNKGFWSEERLRKHKDSHSRKPSSRAPTQAKIECPVKKVNADGTEEKCQSMFDARPDLLKHLNTDHTPEDATYRCAVCGRRFFWASGLRAHAGSACARGGLACGWPGCARVFRLPCRLREHARAHTGDRPYLCNYPECGWAFRSASKLVRHARRHTDERRHACAACGRAFLRREHLREHTERHHTPHARALHACLHTGCGQSFTNMSSLYMHMKKVHRKQTEEEVAATAAEVSPISAETDQNVYWVSLVRKDEDVVETADAVGLAEAAGDPQCVVESSCAGVTGGAGFAGVTAVAESHAARTHCTWPLQREAPRALLDEDVQTTEVEHPDGSVYTIRSDLFLHGNAPIDEDSTNIGGEGIASETPLDADLCLIDSHPTIDLMQEELMYDDAAVDEASFRVFLLNGDELT